MFSISLRNATDSSPMDADVAPEDVNSAHAVESGASAGGKETIMVLLYVAGFVR